MMMVDVRGRSEMKRRNVVRLKRRRKCLSCVVVFVRVDIEMKMIDLRKRKNDFVSDWRKL